jgi:hypothetical protein
VLDGDTLFDGAYAMRWWPVTLFLLGISVLSAQPDASPKPGSLTLEEVVQDSKTNVPEDVIIDTVRKNAKAFDLNAQEIAELRKAGVSDIVIKYLRDPSLPPPALRFSTSGFQKKP